MYKLECAQLFDGCPGVVEGETTDDVLAKAAAHAADAHDLSELDSETVEAVRNAIIAA